MISELIIKAIESELVKVSPEIEAFLLQQLQTVMQELVVYVEKRISSTQGA